MRYIEFQFSRILFYLLWKQLFLATIRTLMTLKYFSHVSFFVFFDDPINDDSYWAFSVFLASGSQSISTFWNAATFAFFWFIAVLVIIFLLRIIATWKILWTLIQNFRIWLIFVALLRIAKNIQRNQLQVHHGVVRFTIA